MRGFILLLTGLALAALSLLLSRVPGVVEWGYGTTLGPALARRLSLATGWIPISVSLGGLLLLVAWVGWRAVAGIRAVRAGRIKPLEALGRGAARGGGLVGVLLIAFYLLWGLNYARAPLEARLDLVVPEDDLATLIALAEHAVDRVNEAYVTLHGTPDADAPTAITLDPARLSSEMRTGWIRVGDALGMGGWADRPYGPVKVRGSTWYLQAFDLLGIYSPFTGEAHVNGAAPTIVAAASIGHEQAHQRTITRESEATFAGALAAIHTDDPLLRYAGWARIVRSVLRDLGDADADARETMGDRLHRGVLRDWQDYARWSEENRSVAGPVASAVNDGYLRTHRVPGGIRSYAMDTRLFTAWFARHDGRLVLPGTPGG
ncbi:MAG: DUF3810 family protein [Longimicrobiales bacterium]|nr:DUF3810 family protein [Longimicrobiales bacterium]